MKTKVVKTVKSAKVIEPEVVPVQPLMLQVISQEKNKEVYRAGRYFIVIIKDDKGKRGIGISRKSYLDKPNYQKGEGLATSRAMKALKMKQEGKHIGGNSLFLG